jgi:dimethylhistidine N-methyltransferase
LTDISSDGAPRQRGDIVAFHDHGPPPADFGVLFLAGLARQPRSLAGRMLLDRRSAAFRRICALPEYYIQRAELEILRDRAVDLARAIGPDSQLVDFGRGFSAQLALLLSTLDRPWGYVAIDHDRAALLDDARRVQSRYPKLWVEAVRADMRQAFDLPPNAGGGRRIAYCPGNAIGNFDPTEALALLSLWNREIRSGGLLLVGVDLRKSVLILESAYDDSHGHNAALVLDVLRRANRELGADFDVRLFEHRVHFDADRGRVHAELISLGPQEIHIGETRIDFAQGEALHVEDSWKYSVEDFHALARGAGFRPREVWFDAKELFSLHLLEAG